MVSDAQEILGIGDWGVNGTDISIGKLAVYTAAAGIDPNRVIAVNLDVGTDNEQLLNSPIYLGNRHARLTGQRYDDFVARYLQDGVDARSRVRCCTSRTSGRRTPGRSWWRTPRSTASSTTTYREPARSSWLR